MKKFLWAILLLVLNASAASYDFAGIHLVDRMNMGTLPLELNGGGIRTKWFFNIYVAALYLPQKQKSAEAIVSADQPRRIVMYILHDLSGSRMYGAFQDGMEDNNTPAELKALDLKMQQMKQIFESVNEVKPGDIVMLDYVPGTGTKINVNGTERGIIEGVEFNRALLRVWLGKNPVQDDLKKGMLGG